VTASGEILFVIAVHRPGSALLGSSL